MSAHTRRPAAWDGLVAAVVLVALASFVLGFALGVWFP